MMSDNKIGIYIKHVKVSINLHSSNQNWNITDENNNEKNKNERGKIRSLRGNSLLNKIINKDTLWQIEALDAMRWITSTEWR